MIKFLKENYGNRPSSKKCILNPFLVNKNERLELKFLRNEIQKMGIKDNDAGSEKDSEESDEEEDYVDDLIQEQLKK